MNGKNLALRPYIEKVGKICEGLSKQDLVALIVAIAGEESPTQRQDYLSKLKKHLPAGRSGKNHPALQEEQSLLDELQGFRESVQARIASIDDGTYWDDPDYDEDEDNYYDDDPDYLSEDQQIGLAEFFDDADNYFMQNRLSEAKALYEAIFALIGEIEEYGFMPDIEVDIREAHARYCRAVYELAEPGERVREMGKAMAVNQPQHDFDNLKEGDLATFQDVIDAQVGELIDIGEFLPQWEKFLADEGTTPDRLARLRLETAYMISGFAGIQKLAQSWKEKQPAGYLVWMEYLAKSEKWQDLCDVAQEALDHLPSGNNRRSAAGYLVEAGRNCGKDDFVLQGRREAFRSSANGANLLHLIAEADRQQVWQEEIFQAITILREGSMGDYCQKPLLAKLFLMDGDFKSLAELCKGENVYGWSGGSPGALLFCAVLYCNSKGDEQCPLIKSLLAEYADDGMYFDSNPLNDEQSDTTFLEQITKGLREIDISNDEFTRHIGPTLKNGRKRIEYIVSNKYRNAYDRAARTLGAMAEMLVAQGSKQQAKELIHTYYFQLYNRHSAFRREVREVVARSPLLVGMGVK